MRDLPQASYRLDDRLEELGLASRLGKNLGATGKNTRSWRFLGEGNVFFIDWFGLDPASCGPASGGPHLFWAPFCFVGGTLLDCFIQGQMHARQVGRKCPTQAGCLANEQECRRDCG